MNRRVGLILGLLAAVPTLWLGYMAVIHADELRGGRSHNPSNPWYVRQWRAAEEPSLLLQSQDPKSLRSERFTWLRTFHAPVFVRLDWLADGQVRMTATELTGAGGYDPGVVARRVERLLSREERADLDRAKRTLKPFRQFSLTCWGGLDGSQWMLEASESGKHVFIDLWSPEEGPVRAYALKLLGLTGWTYDYYY